ncbi:hypothetical protein [Winogradskyella ouciana]|uniref:Uncharacterized protein n=1 Tax=Winogradskyella ouciana TaxID=2608631 RepID=A0A7K1G9N4_9FLAO|nr:hypothetical protein [Winogradskyella ouciana]MTE26007.1 hypothetical protein [Winogradskyella ouciana]
MRSSIGFNVSAAHPQALQVARCNQFMKKILTGITFILLLTQCSRENIAYNSTLVFNGELISQTISLWKDGIKSKDSFTSGRISQFNKDMSIFYQENRGGSTKELNPFYYSSVIPYYHGNENRIKPLILDSYLENSNTTIKDSITYNKEIIFEKDKSILMSSNIRITLYKINYHENDTWFVGKINHDEIYQNSVDYSMPVFTYKYSIKNNRISSYLTCNINYEIEGNQNTFYIKLNDIDVINDKVEYEDFTKEYLSDLSENLKNLNINVFYK